MFRWINRTQRRHKIFVDTIEVVLLLGLVLFILSLLAYLLTGPTSSVTASSSWDNVPAQNVTTNLSIEISPPEGSILGAQDIALHFPDTFFQDNSHVSVADPCVLGKTSDSPPTSVSQNSSPPSSNHTQNDGINGSHIIWCGSDVFGLSADLNLTPNFLGTRHYTIAIHDAGSDTDLKASSQHNLQITETAIPPIHAQLTGPQSLSGQVGSKQSLPFTFTSDQNIPHLLVTLTPPNFNEYLTLHLENTPCTKQVAPSPTPDASGSTPPAPFVLDCGPIKALQPTTFPFQITFSKAGNYYFALTPSVPSYQLLDASLIPPFINLALTEDPAP